MNSHPAASAMTQQRKAFAITTTTRRKRAHSSTVTMEEERPQQQQQPYEELKWTEAPLFYQTNDNDVSPSIHDHENNKRRHVPLHAETTALLVVDVQPEYWSHCPSVQQDFPHFPENMARLLQTCRSQKAKIIWVRANYRLTHSPWLVQFERLRGKLPGYMVEVPCDPSSEDFTCWEDFCSPLGGECIIPKSSWSSTSETALKEVLRVSGIDTVLVCGLITSVCVQHSAFGVFEAGYRTLLVTDACADRGRARHEAALALYGDYMYELVTTQDLCHPKTGLLPAKPVWLTLNSIRQCSASNSNNNNVSPLSSFGDLQNALPENDDKKQVEEENEASTEAPSCVTTSSSGSSN